MTAVTQWVNAYIGFGSNLNDPMNQIQTAAAELAGLETVKKLALSPLYISAPVGPQDQPDYVNAVMSISTCLSPFELLNILHAIENDHGRERQVRWGARTLDLDILIYGDECIDTPDLTIPHRELPNRPFVLYPLSDICQADLAVPGYGKLAELIENCPYSGLKRLSS